EPVAVVAPGQALTRAAPEPTSAMTIPEIARAGRAFGVAARSGCGARGRRKRRGSRRTRRSAQANSVRPVSSSPARRSEQGVWFHRALTTFLPVDHVVNLAGHEQDDFIAVRDSLKLAA